MWWVVSGFQSYNGNSKEIYKTIILFKTFMNV